MFYLTLFIFCFVYYLGAGFAINITYHRGLSHRSLTIWKPLERFLVLLGLPAGTPIQLVGNHRFHHQNTDVEHDPHSPIQDGFWHAHVGWYIGTKNPIICFLYSIAGPVRTIYDGWNRPRTNQQYNYLAGDIAAEGFYKFISRPWPYMIACWMQTGIFFGVAYYVWGWTGLISLWVTLVIIYNLGDAIDSVAHIFGERPYDAEHFARNNFLLGYLTLGEGWHANHHTFPFSARHGLLEEQHDVIWGVIKIMNKCGLVSNIKIPPPEQIQARLLTRQ